MFGSRVLWTQELFPIIEKQKEKTDINRLLAGAEEDITQMERNPIPKVH